MTGLEFQDNLACPDCGARAEAIGRTFTDAQELTGFQETPILLTTRRDGGRFFGNEPGLREVVVGKRDVTRHGVTMTEDVKRDAIELSHHCTNPECSVVFPRALGRRWVG